MPRPIWKGHISFGLVNIPVVLYPADQKSELKFHLIDRRNKARVRYERINESTGKEVPWGEIVKGYENDDGDLVIINGEKSERGTADATNS